jgi:hypothetical protein
MPTKAMQRFVAIYCIFKCQTLNRKIKTHFYKSLILPILYGAPASGYMAKSNMKELQTIRNKILRLSMVGTDSHQIRQYTSRGTSEHCMKELKEHEQDFIDSSARRHPDISSVRQLRHCLPLPLEESKADTTVTHYKFKQPTSDALVSQ